MQYRVRWYSEDFGEGEMSFDDVDSAIAAFRNLRSDWGPIVLSLFSPDGVELDYHDSL